MRIPQLLAGSTIAILFAVGCGAVEDPDRDAGTISIRVTVDGVGYPNADLEIETDTSTRAVTTGPDGRVELADWPAGAYTVRLLTRPPDVEFATTTITGSLAADGTATLEFAGLTKLGDIEGRVTVDGDGLDFAQIEIRVANVTTSTRTIFDGTYAFGGLTPGNYQVTLVTPPPNVVFDRTMAMGDLAAGATEIVNFVGVTSSVATGIAIPDNGVPLSDAERLTSVTAYISATDMRIDIGRQWTPPAAGEEIQLIVGGEAVGADGVQAVMDFGVDNMGNAGATMFRRSDFTVLGAEVIAGDATTDPATLTVPLQTTNSTTTIAAFVEGVEYTVRSMDITAFTTDDVGTRVFVGVLPVDLEAFIALINGN